MQNLISAWQHRGCSLGACLIESKIMRNSKIAQQNTTHRGDKLNRLKKRLLYLWTGEFAAACTFILVYRLHNPGLASLTALLYLIFILLQGSAYWFYRYILIIRRKSLHNRAIKILSVLRWLNMIFIVIVGMIIPIIKSSYSDLLIATGIFIFGVIEFINYYWYRLSYGKSGFNIAVLLSKKLQKSSISRLISKER